MNDLFALLCALFLSGGVLFTVLGWRGLSIKMPWMSALLLLVLGFSGILKDFIPQDILPLISSFWFWITPVPSILISYGLGMLLAAGHTFVGRGKLLFQGGLNLLFYGLFLFLYSRM